ncbi:hypothetical protein [Thalassovita sp.]|uniref:hypothetical protein n=1 Tax=Thalassovita sp. TaxID=1979401 RepID=UPI002B271844|nr:hypothetical protein [Thalassovita sp.]
MSFLRPEAATQLRRWREALVALALSLLGLYWALTSFGLLQWLGYFITALGALWVFLAVRRARFRVGMGGAGIVEVDEGRISYFGPLVGGSLAVPGLVAVRLIRRDDGGLAWFLLAQDTTPLNIPVNADGAEALYDVFATLPGLNMQALLKALKHPPSEDVLIWHSEMRRLH